jgi:hypothetical protein
LVSIKTALVGVATVAGLYLLYNFRSQISQFGIGATQTGYAIGSAVGGTLTAPLFGLGAVVQYFVAWFQWFTGLFSALVPTKGGTGGTTSASGAGTSGAGSIYTFGIAPSRQGIVRYPISIGHTLPGPEVPY